jgi:hypothetical protein
MKSGVASREAIGTVFPRVLLALALAFEAGGCGGSSPSNASAAVLPPQAGKATPSPPMAGATRDHVLTRAALGPWWGSGCPRNGDCGCGEATDLAQEFDCQMNELRAADIPVGVYLFDGSSWSERDSRHEGTCEGEDCCSWKLGDETIERLRREHVRALVHFWGGCHNAHQYARAHERLGGSLLGFYLDDGSSDQELKAVNDFMRSVSPGDFENVAKSHQSHEPMTSDNGLAAMANVAYVGDVRNDFLGLKDGIARLLEKARLIPAPLNELTAYDYETRTAPERETYVRRLHWGAFQPIMAHTPFMNSDPWRPDYDSDLVAAYRQYAWLHKELTPYFLSYARRMHEQPDQPLIRPGPAADSMLVGEEIFVQVVTARTSSMDIALPPGQWVDYWDEAHVVSGTLNEHPAPVRQEPIFVKLGALIPLEVEREYAGHGTRASAGSLTILAFPSGTSTFRYLDDDANAWTTFRSVADATRITLSSEPPYRGPLIYRVGRVATRPGVVRLSAGALVIESSGGGGLAELETENEVNGSETSAWFYDANAHRLIVKIVP